MMSLLTLLRLRAMYRSLVFFFSTSACPWIFSFFFFNNPAPTKISPLPHPAPLPFYKPRVEPPVEAPFGRGAFPAIVRAIENGDRLIIDEVSPVPLGAGMSLSIADPTLEIEGYL